ncbi:MAG: hypothetical protein R2822_21935 [Spirosomataceae bacterium]
MKNNIRIGCGAGFSGDRIEPAVLWPKGGLDYLVLGMSGRTHYCACSKT